MSDGDSDRSGGGAHGGLCRLGRADGRKVLAGRLVCGVVLQCSSKLRLGLGVQACEVSNKVSKGDLRQSQWM